MNTSKKNKVIAGAGIAVLLIGSSFAYFMDKDSKTNHFTVGDISVEVNEPNWDPGTGTDITPNKEMKKDPQVTNTGTNDAFAFVTVKVPKANVETADASGKLVAAKVQDLFTYKVNTGWKLIKTDNSNDSYNEYVYAYEDENGKMKVVKKGETTGTVFDSVKFINIIDEQQSGKNLDIDVSCIGIQTADLGTDVPLDIYNLAVNQNK